MTSTHKFQVCEIQTGLKVKLGLLFCEVFFSIYPASLDKNK